MSLLEDLHELLLIVNGGPGTSRKPMRLGDGSELSRLERALEQLPHLEEGARLLAMGDGKWTEENEEATAAWLAAEAERKRQEKSDG